MAQSYEVFLLGRAVQGMGAAAARVLTDAIVRDCFVGSDMARIISLMTVIFIIVQIMAPITGQLTMMVASWRAILVTMLVLALVQIFWFWLRLPETLRPEYRRALSVRRVFDGVQVCLKARIFVGYALGMALMLATLLAYLGSSPVLFGSGLYDLGRFFSVAFGVIACAMGIAAFINSWLVRRFGMRRISHIALCGFVATVMLQLMLANEYDGRPPLVIFIALLATAMFLFSLIAPNFTAIAMEPVGAVAGTASSLLYCNANVLGAMLGALIGLAFDGTVFPLTLSYLGLGLATIVVILWTERGHMFSADVSPDCNPPGTVVCTT